MAAAVIQVSGSYPWGNKRAVITAIEGPLSLGGDGVNNFGAILASLYVPVVGTTMTLNIWDDPAGVATAPAIVTWATADGKGPFDLRIPFQKGMVYTTTAAAMGIIVLTYSQKG